MKESSVPIRTKVFPGSTFRTWISTGRWYCCAEFRRETLSMCSPLFEKCIIYDGGARRYEIHEHVEEVLEFWEGIKERADKIDFKELLDEKLGYPAPLSYDDWVEANHYHEIKIDAQKN